MDELKVVARRLAGDEAHGAGALLCSDALQICVDAERCLVVHSAAMPDAELLLSPWDPDATGQWRWEVSVRRSTGVYGSVLLQGQALAILRAVLGPIGRS